MRTRFVLALLAVGCTDPGGDDTSDDTADDTADTSDTEDTGPDGDAYSGPCAVDVDYLALVQAGSADWVIGEDYADFGQIGGPEVTYHSGTVAVNRSLPLGPDVSLGIVVEFTDALTLGTLTSTFESFGVTVGEESGAVWITAALPGGAAVDDGTMTFGTPVGWTAWDTDQVQFYAASIVTGAAAGQQVTCVALTLDIPASVQPISGAGEAHNVTTSDTFSFDSVSWVYTDEADTRGDGAPVTFAAR